MTLVVRINLNMGRLLDLKDVLDHSPGDALQYVGAAAAGFMRAVVPSCMTRATPPAIQPPHARHQNRVGSPQLPAEPHARFVAWRAGTAPVIVGWMDSQRSDETQRIAGVIGPTFRLPARSIRGRGLSWRQRLLALAAVVVLLFGSAIIGLSSLVSERYATEILLGDLVEKTFVQSGLEWRAVAERGVSAELRAELDTSRAASAALVAQIGTMLANHPEFSGIRELRDTYDDEVDADLALIEQGRFAEERALDLTRVEPAFIAFKSTVERAEGVSRAGAIWASNLQLVGSTAAFGLAVFMLSLLLFRYQRRMHAAELLEREALERTEAATRAREQTFRLLFETNPQPMGVYDRETLKFLEINLAAVSQYGYAREEFVAMKVADIAWPDEVARPSVESLDGLGHELPSGIWRHIRKDGTTLDAQISSQTLRFADRDAVLIVAEDVTERRRAERTQSQLAAIVESAQDAILSIDNDGAVATWNAGAERLYGYPASEARGRSLPSLLDPEHAEQLVGLLGQVAAGEASVGGELSYEDRDGAARQLAVSCWPIRRGDGTLEGVSVVARDISDRKALEVQLAHQALHDPLTGLPNRVLFLERLGQALVQRGRARRTKGPRIALLYLDLDDFKRINDTLGHGAGDQLLAEVARRLEASLREGDTVSRFGGDEFTLLLHDVVDETEAGRAAERILANLAAPFVVAGNEIVQAASIGVVYPRAPFDEPGELLRKADVALHEAKSKGRGRAELYDPGMAGHALRQFKLEVALRQAIEAGSIEVHYQPLVELATGRIVEVEALARWTDPLFGSVAPVEFIPVAERAGLIVALGEHVLRVACTQLAAWVAESPDLAPSVAVNISPTQLGRADFVAAVSRILAETGARADRLELEITEGIVIDELVGAFSTLEALRRLGIRIALDDFGTGYSSLTYAKRLNVDTVKIDKSFVDGLGVRTQDTAVVTAALAFARTLGMSTVAEGIETESQREQLELLGCEIGQGYLFSRPVPAETLTGLFGTTFSKGSPASDRITPDGMAA